MLDGIRSRTGIEITLDEFLESPHVFIGSVDGLVAKLREQRERLGISSIMVGDLDTLAPGRGAAGRDMSGGCRARRPRGSGRAAARRP